MEMTPLELYAFELNNNDPKYYSQVPAVIFNCTFVAKEARKDNPNYGKEVRKRLSPYAITLYTFIKQLAGKSNRVWMNTEHLAEACGMSVGKISDAKKELLQPMEQLNGKSLIQVETRKKSFLRKDGTKGAKEYHVITPVHIWPENNAYMATFNHQMDLKLGTIDEESDSRREPDQASDSRREPDSLGSDSRREPINKNSETDETCIYKTEKQSSPAVCSLNSGNESVFSCEDQEKLKQSQIRDEKLKDLLRRDGADDSFLKWLFKTYPSQKIREAAIYFEKQSKKKQISNPIAYIRTALERGYV